MSQYAAKIMILIGAFVLIMGVIFYFFGDKLGWLGKLPGDIRIKKENSSFYFPLTTCILLSLLITLIFKVIQWLK